MINTYGIYIMTSIIVFLGNLSLKSDDPSVIIIKIITRIIYKLDSLWPMLNVAFLKYRKNRPNWKEKMIRHFVAPTTV